VCRQPIVGRWVVITVSDTGQGISDDVMPRIFEPFFTTRSPEGHGLGLPQVAGIVAQHRGHITVDTEPGQGTTVKVYLPEAPEPTQSQAAPDQDQANAGGPAPLVLVVEDNPTTRGALAEALSVLGYRSDIAINGLEALETLSCPDHGISVLLCDWVMPRMGGEELLDVMKARGITVPVVAVSGHPMRYFDRTEEIPVSDWLQKPVDLSRLGQAIATALQE
jgi:CheY-like chemotaxis protein